ncbi:hypothetical protein [Sediminibacillus massiliensis]|uniref:hypothetical protein n=1 Tax=Sediminibacillus massiliensis TaxID=1926277 RepID=UPI0009885CD8|nr:hypothetical protein [Sediminibacillus massiliensis]
MNTFKIIVLIIFVLLMYALLKGEKRSLRLIVLSYFSVLSVMFISGIFYISEKYQLNDGPVLDGGFVSLFNWVSAFSYLYILPAFLVMAYRLLGLAGNLFEEKRIRVIMYLVFVAVLWLVGYVSFFIFTLVFYGFAP